MSFIKDEIGKKFWGILKVIWKPFPKWLRVCCIILIVIIVSIIFVPFLFPKYDEWKTYIDKMFNFEKQAPSDTITYVDNTPKDTIIKQKVHIRQNWRQAA